MAFKYFSSITLFITFINFIVHAQSPRLTGKVQDKTGSAVKFVTINLLKAADSALIAATVTDPAGKFSISSPAPGKYFLEMTAIGFTTYGTAVFECIGDNFTRDFGTIQLQEETKKLKDVTVAATRPVIVQKSDRMVINIDGTVLAAGRTAFDVLSKAPGVFISPDGSINLNGHSGVSVMIDGKLTYLSAADLRTMLESMPAENIKNIEVITNPSAKYDAEGTAGILNINLKKNTQAGMNGSVYSSLLYDFHKPAYSGGGGINYKSGKWNSFFNLDASSRGGGRDATFTRIFRDDEKSTYLNQDATGNFTTTRPHTIRLGTDYTLTSKTTAGFFFNYSLTRLSSDFLTNTYIGYTPGDPEQYIDAYNYSYGKTYNITGNLHLASKLDTSGQIFSADLFYVKIRSTGEANFYNYFTDIATGAKSQDFLYTSTPGGYDIYSVKADYTYPFKKSQQLDAGIKASHVISDNDSRFYFNNSNTLIPDPQRTDHFNFRENIFAAYINYNNEISKKISMQAGLRAEQTDNTGKSYTTGLITTHRYTDLFPSLFLNQKFSKDYSINYSYSRRITRPGYGNLNPFRFYRDPYTWEEGNPYLRPQYSNSFSITQLFKGNYSLAASYESDRDVIAELPVVNTDSATTAYTTGNVNHGHNFSLTLTTPIQVTRKWFIQNTLITTYNKLQADINNQVLNNDHLNFYAGSYQTLQLPYAITMELNIWYKSPAAQGLYTIGAMWRTDIGFKRSFYNKKLQLSIGCNDLFKTQRYVFTTHINGNVNDFDQYFRVRNIGASLRYNFSRGQKINTKRRSTAVEEVDRT